MSDIETELESIAKKIALHANGDIVPFKDRLDAFKALTSYQFNKNKPKKTDSDDNEDTFNGFRERVATATNGGKTDFAPREPTGPNTPKFDPG